MILILKTPTLLSQRPMLKCRQHLVAYHVVSVGGVCGTTKRFDRIQVWLLEQSQNKLDRNCKCHNRYQYV